MLYGVVESAIFASGLDPYLGILHADEYKEPTFAFDLIEPFRPWVDALIAQLCREGLLEGKHFTPKENGFWLSKEVGFLKKFEHNCNFKN